MFSLIDQSKIVYAKQQCPYKIKTPDFKSMRITPPQKLQPIVIQTLSQNQNGDYQPFPIEIFRLLGVPQIKESSLFSSLSCVSMSCTQCKAISNETLLQINSKQNTIKRRDSCVSDKQTTGAIQQIDIDQEDQQQNLKKNQYIRLWKKYKKKGKTDMKFDYAYIQFGHLSQKQWIKKLQQIFS